MFKKIRKFSFIITIVFSMVFSGFPHINQVFAAIGDIGHWRDSIGGQIPGTGFAAFNFNNELQNDGIYSRPNNGTIQIDESGDYLIIATTRDNDTSNGRYNSQLRVELTAGTGDIFSSYYSGYSRDTSEDESWTRALGVIIGANPGTQFQIQKRRDTDAPTGGSVTDASDIQIVRINPTNYGIYGIGGVNNGYGGITPNTVEIDQIITESDTGSIEGNIATDTVTIKGNNKKYLVAWSVSFTGTGSRTQRIGHLEYDGTDELPTRSYCYRRNVTNEYCGLGSMDIIETTTTDIDIQTEVFRGPGVGPDQGGANSDENLNTDGNGQMIILEMPDYLEAIRSFDSTGLQNITSSQTLNIARDIDFNDSLSFTKASNIEIDITNPASLFSWANIWTARNNVAAGQRQTSFGSITIDGVEQTIGRHGSYSRGNQSTTDTFAMSFHPAGIFTTATASQNIGVNSDPLPGGESGGNDQTQPNTLGFFALNLDTLVEPQLEQSGYRWFENNNSTDVGITLAIQNNPATLSIPGEEFRLRSLINLDQNQLRQNERDFKLQFAQQVGTCDVGFVGESYIDVTSSTDIAFNNNVVPNDGDTLTANPNDPINGLNVVVNQEYVESNNFSNSVSAIGQNQDGKWDFTLIDNGAPADTAYCFRIVESDGTLLNNYSVIPEITTADSFCPAPVHSFPYIQGFEGSIGDWEQSLNDDNDWDINSGTTPSVNTGPSSAIQGSDYIFVEASGFGTGYPDRRSIITSPCFTLPQTPTEFDFQYHMYSITAGTLGSIDLEISSDGITWISLFNETTNQGNQWNQETIDLSSYANQNVRLRFNRFVGNTWQADIAIDDISLDIIPQKISFDVFDSDGNNTVGFNELSISNSRFATSDETGSLTSVTAANIITSTNAINGYTIEVDGTEFTNQYGDAINGIGLTPTISNPGSSQFGLRADTTGTATVSAPYNDATNHAYNTTLFVDEFATGIGDNTVTSHDLEFIANIDPLTPAGEYTATLTFTMHAEFN